MIAGSYDLVCPGQRPVGGIVSSLFNPSCAAEYLIDFSTLKTATLVHTCGETTSNTFTRILHITEIIISDRISSMQHANCCQDIAADKGFTQHPRTLKSDL